MNTTWHVGIVTVSDRSSTGEREDKSGPILKELAQQINGNITAHKVIPDDRPQIEKTLSFLADVEQCDLIMTTGGTGLTARDVTPEATQSVIHKEVPGIAEAMRMETFKQTKMSVLSRGVAGIRGKTLIINFPGSPKAIKECFDVIEPALPHALQLLRGNSGHLGQPNVTDRE